MPNIIGYVENPEDPEWVQLQFDDGSKAPWAKDPSGEFRRQADEIAKKIRGEAPNPMAGAVAGPGVGEPAPAQVAPAAPAAPAPAPPVVAAPAAPPAPIEAAAPQPSPRADAPAGLARSGEQRTVAGLTTESQAKVEQADQAAIEARAEADRAANEAKTQQVNAEWMRLNEQEKAGLAKTAQLEEQKREMDARVERHTAELDEIVGQKIDASKAFAGDRKLYAFMAVMGAGLQNFGAALNGRGNVADAGKLIENWIDREVKLQTEQRALEYKNGLITGDQLRADQERVRAELASGYVTLAKTREARAKTEAEKLAVPAMVKHAEAMRSKAIADSAKALAQQETRVEQFDVPKPVAGTGLPRGPVEEELRGLGISKEAYTKALTSKVGSGGDNAPTAASTAQFIKGVDEDLAAMRSLMKDGVMPNKVASNQITDVTRAALQRFGIPLEADGSANLVEFNQRYTRRIIAEAKKMGGVITENDLKFTERVAGQSPQAIESWLRRMRADANKELVAHLGGHFPDYTQRVADIMLQGQSMTRGVAGAPSAEPFEVTNVEHQSAPGQQFPDTPLEQENRERIERRKSVLQPLRESEENQRRLKNPRFGMPY